MSKRVWYHIAFWALYILYKSYLNFDAESMGANVASALESFLQVVLVQLAFAGVKIPLVYALFCATDRYLQKRASVTQTIMLVASLFAVAIFCMVLVNHFVVFGMIYQMPTEDLPTSLTAVKSLSYWFFILAFVGGVAISIKLVRLGIAQKIEEQELVKKKLEMELQFLKAQSNPHFLFNTLNNIYGLARKNSDKTAEVVLRLSSMLRYMLYETANESIAIEHEIKIIEDYIELEKLRYSNRLNVVFHHSVDNKQEKLAPLILLPFVENAFKHGAGESRFRSEININLTLKDQRLTFVVANSKETTDSEDSEPKIGLANIKRQLELIYPGHELAIDQTSDTFKVALNIDLAWKNTTVLSLKTNRWPPKF